MATPALPNLAGLTQPPSFAQAEIADQQESTRHEKFRTRMEALLPWPKLLAVFAPFYFTGAAGVAKCRVREARTAWCAVSWRKRA